jgi:hydroxyacylglutathione hydrolase
VLDAWTDAGHELATVPQMSVAELSAQFRQGDIAVLDVRGRSEWEAGHMPGVENIPLGLLEDRLDEVPHDRPLVVHCQGGGRSAIAASLLRAHGFADVFNLSGGFAKWQGSGNPTEREARLAEVQSARD